MDFLLLGCDGIYDKLTSQEVGDAAWAAISLCQDKNQHELSLLTAESVMKVAMSNGSIDNITAAFIGFDNLLKNLGI